MEDFISTLGKLRKSSIQSVSEEFDNYKKYLHVERNIQKVLEGIIEKVDESNKKSLILVCGSAGDGKSHLISYLKYNNKLNNFIIFNDASESDIQSKTAIEVLEERLKDFNDENIDKTNDNKKVIIAINLGILSKLIEKDSFSVLKKYVEDNNIISGFSNSYGYKENSSFQHINFADYQLFSLTKDGVNTTYLENIFNKVFEKSDKNPFYKSYKEYRNKSVDSMEIIFRNYEYLMDKNNRKKIINKVVEAIVIDKLFISTRDILNFIFDIIVHPNMLLDENKKKIENKISYDNIIDYSTPMILSEYDGISILIDSIRKNDTLLISDSKTDDEMTLFYSSENISEEVKNIIDNSTYDFLNTKGAGITTEQNINIHYQEDSDFKIKLYKFIKRISDNNTCIRKDVNDFLKLLYLNNIGKNKELVSLYKNIINTIYSWIGKKINESICINNSSYKYALYENITIKPFFTQDNNVDNIENIDSFSHEIRIAFKVDGIKDNLNIKDYTLDIDFSLYCLTYKIEKGYRPTVEDMNIYTEFNNYINKLIQLNSKYYENRDMYIIDKHDENRKFVLKYDEDFNKFSFEVK